jgi:hypothetical protein
LLVAILTVNFPAKASEFSREARQPFPPRQMKFQNLPPPFRGVGLVVEDVYEDGETGPAKLT